MKIPVFVEYVVRGEQSFVTAGHDPAAVNQRRRIEILLAGALWVDVDVAHEQRRPADARGQFVQRTEIVVDEPLFGEQVARRVARDSQFGRGDELCACIGAAAIKFADSRAVATQIADGRVDLGQRDFHGLRANLSLRPDRGNPKPWGPLTCVFPELRLWFVLL